MRDAAAGAVRTGRERRDRGGDGLMAVLPAKGVSTANFSARLANEPHATTCLPRSGRAGNLAGWPQVRQVRQHLVFPLWLDGPECALHFPLLSKCDLEVVY